MKCGNTGDVIYKEVVVIGNGPSGIALSYMLSGNLPYLISDSHPDEMLSARLQPAVGQCLVQQDLGELSSGLEGRSTNQVSLLFDSLQHPCADIGLEMEPLIEFRKAGIEIDHIVLGKGPPGGSWHKMDPYILTLSLGSWMALPGLPFHSRDSGEKRAFACNVAKYYVQYVEQMHLSKYFKDNVSVSCVKPWEHNLEDAHAETRLMKKNHRPFNRMNTDLFERIEILEQENEDSAEEKRTCFISNAINRLLLKSNRKSKPSRCKRPREEMSDKSPSRKIREMLKAEKDSHVIPIGSRRDAKRSISLSSCDSNVLCDSFYSRSYNETSFSRYSLRSSSSLDFNNKSAVPCSTNSGSNCDCTGNSSRWLVQAFDNETGERTSFSCKYLVLANGGSDMPNRLEISRHIEDPEWLMHDLRSLENQLDIHLRNQRLEDVEPVLVVGAGLSAADAVIAVRGKNIPVIHVFRNKSSDLSKQLPENMYPEYHKVHQMMQDGGSTYPLYSAYPEHTLTGIDGPTNRVTLTSKSGDQVKIHVSFAAVLIGSRPDLRFFPNHSNVGVHKNLPIDCKTNTVAIDKLTHKIDGYENLFAVGPLAGDNFVRFIPGGALAVVSELYKQKN